MLSGFIRAGLLAGVLVLAGCNDSDDNELKGTSEAAFTLQLLHLSDIDGGGTAAMFNIDWFSALVDAFRGEMPVNTIVASSGDNYIPGPIFQASVDLCVDMVVGNAGQGRGETQIQNAMGIQISAVGNHGLDTGAAGFAGTISSDGEYSGASYPYISANIDFLADPETAPLVEDGGQDAGELAGKITPSAVIAVNGDRI